MSRFTDEIDRIVDETCSMAKLSINMLERALQAISDRNVDIAKGIISHQDKIEKMDDDIEDSALRMLMIYQPTASDARVLATVLKTITHLERISKYSTNIATATVYLADKPVYEVANLINPIGETALNLVKTVSNGFETFSVNDFGNISETDDHLDEMMQKSITEIVEYIDTHENSADVCTYYISVLKFLERIGDHACKMAEKVCFMVTGMRATIH